MMIIHARIARGLSQRELANLVGLKEQQIQRYESEKYSSASLNRLREIAKALNLSITEIVELNAEKLKAENLSSDSEELEWQKFPIKEMYKREWFENFSGSLNAALQDGESLVKQFITRVRNRPVLALHRKRVRAESIIDEYKLLAWECRVLSLADKAKINYKYDHGSIDHKWLTELIQKSRLTDGPRMAQDQLREAGIAMIIEPHMPNTHLDGAVFFHRDTPVIGLTIRYDRLDNFWFVLIHEIIHVIKHLRKLKVERIFDDLDSPNENEIEIEADTLAGEALIPEEIWNNNLARYTRSEESVKRLADDLNISPAIVAGRIRHEANNYVILNKMVGKGEVRKHFPDTGFDI